MGDFEDQHVVIVTTGGDVYLADSVRRLDNGILHLINGVHRVQDDDGRWRFESATTDPNLADVARIESPSGGLLL
jgi:hypothetical protein